MQPQSILIVSEAPASPLDYHRQISLTEIDGPSCGPLFGPVCVAPSSCFYLQGAVAQLESPMVRLPVQPRMDRVPLIPGVVQISLKMLSGWRRSSLDASVNR